MAAKFTPKKNKVTGTKKKDKIVWQNKSAWKKNLTVDAGLKNDTIDFTKSSKTNTFIGGKGNDTIKTGKGTSTIVINKGDGNDTIYNNGKKTTIKFNKPNSKDKVTAWEKKGNDLIMTYTHVKAKKEKKAVTEKITLKNFYKNDGTIANTNLYLKNKYNKKISTLVKDLKITSVKGVLRGTYKGETLNGTNGNDKIYGNGGNDIINGGAGDDVVNGGAGNDLINGDAGDDVIYGVSGTNILNGGKGNDKLYSGTGVDTFKFTSGDGNDTIYDATSADKIEFTGDVDSINYSKGNNDLIITRTTGTVTDKINVVNYFTSDDNIRSISYNGEEHSIIGGAGEVNGTTGGDIMFATQNTTDITPGEGDDFIDLKGSSGVTVHIYNNEGSDTINNLTENDTIYFEEAPYAVVQYDPETNTLKLDRVTIEDYPNSSSSDAKIKFNTEDAQVLSEYLESKNVYFGTNQNDEYSNITGVICTYDGDDIISAGSVGQYKDTRIYAGNGNDTITGGNGSNDGYWIHAGNGNDVITTQRGFNHVYGEDGDDIITGGDAYGCHTYSYGGAGNDTIYSGVSGSITGGPGNDLLVRSGAITTGSESAGQINYHFDKAGDGNDIIYDYLDSFNANYSFIHFDNLTLENQDAFYETLKYESAGSDLIIRYGENYAHSIKFKGYLGLWKNTKAELKIDKLYEGDSASISVTTIDIYDVVKEKIGNTLYGDYRLDVFNMSGEQYSDYSIVASFGGNDRITTVADRAITVIAGDGDNTINSYGNDSIVVDKEGNDTIELYGANTEKSVWVETGSKATINGVMDLIPSGLSSVPLTINFTDQDFTKNDVMLYHNYYTNELHFVTRNYGLDVALTGIYDGTFNEDNAEGSNYIYEEEGNNAFAKFNIIDKNGNLANIRELTNYYDMSKHSNEFCNEFEAIYFDQNGSSDWLIDSSDAEANDSYETYIPCTDAKIDIYDKGGNDELIFESPFVNDNGNSTFFDVIITRNSDNSLASSSFGDDLYFSGNMSKLFDDNSSNDTYTCVHNYFDASSENQKGVGYIETIEDENSYAIDFDKLSALKGQIAGWIAGNTAYSSVSDVIANGSAEQKETLMAYFTGANTYVTA